MSLDRARAEIIVNGLVQGVGFRYFVIRNAERLSLFGYVQNLYSGEVLTLVEGDKINIQELYKMIKLGPPHAKVKNAVINWMEYKNEFKSFEVRY